MEYQKHFFSHRIPVPVIIESPEPLAESGKKYPAIILCHGHSRHKNDGLDVLSHVLTKAGFLTFRFDFRGCGDEAVHKYHFYCVSEWPSDLVQAINYALSLGCVDPGRIGVAGISMGACTVINVAGTDKRIKSVVSMSGIGDCYTWLKYVWEQQGGDFEELKRSADTAAGYAAATGEAQIRNVLEMYHFSQKDLAGKLLEPFTAPGNSAYIAWETMQELLRYKPIEQCKNIDQPVFFLTGSEDFLVPHSQTEDMYQAVSSKVKKHKDYEGVEHNMPMDPKREAVFADICKWFLETL